ncbi:MAG: hypothetical protein MPL62_02935 [Alphaproteobacteria bacterium]|nr:hypothetical protein [Alphaproteobacteria bacterium]
MTLTSQLFLAKPRPRRVFLAGGRSLALAGVNFRLLRQPLKRTAPADACGRCPQKIQCFQSFDVSRETMGGGTLICPMFSDPRLTRNTTAPCRPPRRRYSPSPLGGWWFLIVGLVVVMSALEQPSQ